MKRLWVLAFVFLAGASRAEAGSYVDDPVQNQWFTGSLEAPSPALSKAGVVSIEPYAIYTRDTGAYDSGWGHYSVPNNVNQLQSETLFKYGITDQLSVQTLPSFSQAWNGLASSSPTSVGIGDLPIEFQYRVHDGDPRTGFPSVTFGLGMTFPTGAYDNLSNPLAGFGAGAYVLKEELLFQSLFATPGGYPMRVRVYGDVYEPLGDASVRNASVYGTNYGFRGQANPGLSADWGIGVEYGLNQRWVLALDLVQNYAAGFRLNGTDIVGNSANANGHASTIIALAPAIEYNFTSSVGLIAGVEFSAAGRNTPSYIAPQIALTMAF